MGWKVIHGVRYFYEWNVVEGVPIQKCWGSGEEAQLAAARVETARKERANERRIVKRWQYEDMKMDQSEQEIRDRAELISRQLLDKLGYHMQDGEVRKKNSNTRAAERSAHLAEPKVAVSIEETFALEDDVRQMTLSALGRGGDLNEEALDALHQKVASKVEVLRAELSHPEISGIERILVEQIITAWIQCYVASRLVDTLEMDEKHWRRHQYMERRYVRAQARLTKSLEQLARIRRVPLKYLNSCRRRGLGGE
ncbi:MAG TPA: hypothetical protein VK171_11590 [Fimbriimonas sp.]|nr:hypothetical protein [Fimbriimonas sp.]